MPHSLVLNLLPQSQIPPQYLTGRHFHALFLNLVSALDPALGAFLHDQTHEKAFTLSPLQVSSGVKEIREQTLQWEHKQAIAAGTPTWWRVSLLDDTLFAVVTQLWLHLTSDKLWHLGPANLHITSFHCTPKSNQPWANFSTYAALYEQASVEERQICFSFCTPTSFRQAQYDAALPTRECVFGSLIHRWNKYSAIKLSPNLIEAIFPSFFDIRTEMVADSRSKFIGCVGEVSYRILGDVDPLTIKQINALADFALYSGIGRKTPMGMGMVRRLKNPKRRHPLDTLA